MTLKDFQKLVNLWNIHAHPSCKVQALTVVEMYRSLVQNVKAAVGVRMVRSTLLPLEWYRLMCSPQPEECASYVNGICVCELTWRYLIVVPAESWL